ncbi:MAG TPA: hypothetical protein VFX33_04615 [Actinomycetales bacterium]|nr:hypothetical protein [Actinomycetales bacterium]
MDDSKKSTNRPHWLVDLKHAPPLVVWIMRVGVAVALLVAGYRVANGQLLDAAVEGMVAAFLVYMLVLISRAQRPPTA